MKNAEIITMPNKELAESLREERKRQQKMKFQNAVSQIDQPHNLKQTRKTVARMLTEINKRRMESETQAYVKQMSEEK